MTQQTITILGATGSIGCHALDVIARHRDKYQVFALTAKQNIQALAKQCDQFTPRYAVIASSHDLANFKDLLGVSDTQILVGEEALVQVAADSQCDTVLAGIVGTAGLVPTLAAAKAGKRILLANKEVLVSAGHLFMDAVRANNALLLPVDSEHNALFQCLASKDDAMLDMAGVEKVILTASGGPFLQTPLVELKNVTPEQACAHPNWEMGAKISVDSATMMNKGLEVIEACRLFNLTADQVEVMIHPQSFVHALVMFKDGSVMAQMSQPDMRIPIAHALAWPERIESGIAPLDLVSNKDLNFQAIELERFPCFALARDAFAQGAAALIGLNAANEVAVEAFLARKISFDNIVTLIAETVKQIVGMTQVKNLQADRTQDITTILAVDQLARKQAHLILDKI